MDLTRAREQPDLPIDAALRNITLLFRVLGWVWMAVLVILTPSNDPGADMLIAWGTLALATVTLLGVLGGELLTRFIPEMVLRKIAAGEYTGLGDVTTLADPGVVDDLTTNRENR